MKIRPLGQRIQIKIDEPKAGGLDTSSINAAKESGTVVAMGEDVTLNLNVGDRVYFKAWAVDIIVDGGDKYYFITQDSEGLCAVIK